MTPGMNAPDYTNCVRDSPRPPKLQTARTNLLIFVCISMRRISTHFALAAIYATLLAPFAIGVQESSLHACCLRTGAHHCQGDSHEAGIHSLPANCPYSTPVLLTAYAGIETAKFRISSPVLTGFVTQRNCHSHSPALVRDAAARAPPVALL